MEKQLPQLKVWKINWEFIVSNYLDKSLWKKSWHLFQYKDFIVDLNLYGIDCESDTVSFKLHCNMLPFWNNEYVKYNIANTSVKILQQQIHGAMFRLLMSYDRRLICDSKGYNQILETAESEKSRLREIAYDYLTDNGVTNEDIREVYADNYVNNNSKLDIMLNNYCDYNKYHYATEVLLAFCSATNDKDRMTEILKATENDKNIQLILNEVDEFSKLLCSDEFVDIMTDELEAI